MFSFSNHCSNLFGRNKLTHKLHTHKKRHEPSEDGQEMKQKHVGAITKNIVQQAGKPSHICTYGTLQNEINKISVDSAIPSFGPL